MKLPDGLYRVVLSYACYGVEVKDEYIVETPAIASWSRGQSIYTFIDWVRKKKGTVKLLIRREKKEDTEEEFFN